MLKKLWPFKQGPDGPIRNVADAKALLEEAIASSNDNLTIIQPVSSFLHTVTHTEGYDPVTLAKIVRLLSEGASDIYQALYEEYFSLQAGRRFMKDEYWRHLAEFKENAVAAYRRSVEELARSAKITDDLLNRELAALSARLLENLADYQKLYHLRYFAIEPSLWLTLAGVHALAQQRKFERIPLPLDNRSTSVAQQIARILMMEMAPLSAMMPDQIEATAVITSTYASAFIYRSDPDPAATFRFSPTGTLPPERFSGDTAAEPGTIYFGAGPVMERLLALKQSLGTGHGMPRDLALPSTVSRRKTLAAIKLLISHWSATPPTRTFQRNKINYRFGVVRGFDETRRMIAQSTAAPLESEKNKELRYREQLDLHLYGFITDRTLQERDNRHQEAPQPQKQLEIWEADNISRGGLGALLPKSSAASLRVGQIIGLRLATENSWMLGQVRRFFHPSDKTTGVGVQVLSYQPACVTLRTILNPEVFTWERFASIAQFDLTNGLFLKPLDAENESPILLLERGSFGKSPAFVFMYQDEWLLVRPQEVTEEGEDFERVSYEILDRMTIRH